MSKWLYWVIGAVVIVGAAWWWKGQQGTTTRNPSPAPAAVEQSEEATESTEEATEEGVMGEEENTVTYTDTGFSPKTITVKAGTEVTFVNNSSGSMWVASAVHPTHQLLPGFDQLKGAVKGASYSFTFEGAGSWKYHNHLSPEDIGTVVVTE